MKMRCVVIIRSDPHYYIIHLIYVYAIFMKRVFLSGPMTAIGIVVTHCVCSHCNAQLWYGEQTVKALLPSNPKFSLCCSEGKVFLPYLCYLPPPLRQLLDYNGEQHSSVFRENIKILNAMFAFTTTCGRICFDVNDGRGPYTFRLNGHNHHRNGSLLPTHGYGRPRFAQLYIYDTANEIDNRIYALQRCVPSDAPLCVRWYVT
jgi:hypothetical protein